MDTTRTDRPILEIPQIVPTLRRLFCGRDGVTEESARVLPTGTLAIGRKPAARGLVINDLQASRSHALLSVAALAPGSTGVPCVRLRDQGAKNGTFVNGERIEEVSLVDGDIIRIGDSLLILRHERAALEDAPLPELIGRAPAIRGLRAQVARAGEYLGRPTSTTGAALLLGETGTGKDLAARAIHRLCMAAGRSDLFIPVNCAAIPEGLAESELFGHARGAYTGAREASGGLFRAAHGGTLFLDEVAELPSLVQAKLLRVLETREVSPVGSRQSFSCNVVVIAATKVDLASAVQDRQFRDDLFARLAAIVIELPPLRQRREDILTLFAHHYGGSLRLTVRCAEAMVLSSWPLNVRELVQLGVAFKAQAGKNALLDLPMLIERWRMLSPKPAEGEAPSATAKQATAPAPQAAEVPESPEYLRKIPRSARLPRHVLERLMAEHKGVIARVAAAVDRSPRQVSRWLADLGIPKRPRAK